MDTVAMSISEAVDAPIFDHNKDANPVEFHADPAQKLQERLLNDHDITIEGAK